MKAIYTILFLSLPILVIGQRALFLQRLAKDLNVDSLMAVSVGNDHTIGLIELKDRKTPFVQLINGKERQIYPLSQLSFLPTDLHIINKDSVLLTDNQSKSYLFSPSTQQLEQTKISSPIKKYAPQNHNHYISADGIINSPIVVYNQYESQDYYLNKNVLYKNSSQSNSYFDFHQIDSESADARFARPLADGRWVIGLNKSNGLYIQDHNTIINVLDLPVNNQISKTLTLYHTAEAHGHVYFSGSDYDIYKLDLKTYKLSNITTSQQSKYKNLVSDLAGNLYSGSIDGTVSYITSSNSFLPIPITAGNKPANTFRHYEDQDGWQWWGYRTGISVFNPKDKSHIGFTQDNGLPPFLMRTNAFEILQDKLYIGTYNNGLYELSKSRMKESILAYITTGKEINWEELITQKITLSTTNQNEEIQHVNVIDDKYLVIRTDQNLYVYDGKVYARITSNMGFTSDMHNFFSYTSSNGVINSSPGGYSIFYPERFLEIWTNTSLFIKKANIGAVEKSPQKKQTYYDLGTIDEYYPFITLEIESSINDIGDLSLKYKIDSQAEQDLNNNFLVLANADIGNHEISIRSAYEPSTSSALILKYNVSQRWYNKWWARLLLALSALSFTFYLVKLWYSKNQIEKEMRLLETESLRSYMNPHFISNSLNSINYYILQNEKELASKYIIKFSKLIRRVLQNSEKEFITIEEEISTLRNYIDIEQMRFVGKFAYQIQVDDSVEMEDEIPSFILQPIIENSIWHGLIQKGSEGEVVIHFAKDGNSYLISITDNGIGYDASRSMKSKSVTKRKSFGSKMITKRLDLLNEIYDYKNKIEILDRLNLDGQQGTIVHIRLNTHKA